MRSSKSAALALVSLFLAEALSAKAPPPPARPTMSDYVASQKQAAIANLAAMVVVGDASVDRESKVAAAEAAVAKWRASIEIFQRMNSCSPVEEYELAQLRLRRAERRLAALDADRKRAGRVVREHDAEIGRLFDRLSGRAAKLVALGAMRPEEMPREKASLASEALDMARVADVSFAKEEPSASGK